MDRREARAYAIRRGMEINGWKAPQLAALIHRDPNTVRRWLERTTEPRPDDLIALAAVFGLEARRLLEPPPPPEYPLDSEFFEGAQEGLRSARLRVLDRKGLRKRQRQPQQPDDGTLQ